MPNWNQLFNEVKALGSPHDVLRRKYLAALHEETKRNIITYYSGWLQKPSFPGGAINDEDKNGFMTTVNGLDRSLGLDLILHTPGGETAATESLVDYLRKMFKGDIRAVVPQVAMSGGTMIACASRVILMGKQSSLGPVDPHFGGIPAHGVIEEFKKAYEEIKQDPAKIPVWQPIIAKYSPAFIGECQKAITWSEQLVRDWLATGMLAGDEKKDEKINRIVGELGNHALTLSHARHLPADTCSAMGLKVEMLEEKQSLQDAVLSVHHAYMLTLSQTPACKIIENHTGAAFIQSAQVQIVQTVK
ncbi:MAG TPA: S49 family peptidase [Candidatus Paceibacterota bacterium]|nr:S49 family peptidase [Candidatus Paceibacterota bacterium]